MNLRIKTSKYWVSVIGFLLVFSSLFVLSTAQAQSACKVLDEDISANYTGGCINGFADGEGVASGRNEYIGQFKAGKKHGKGKYKWGRRGEVYEGSWVDDVQNGFGIYIDSSGKLEGNFANGLINGKGTAKYTNGSFYEENFANGLRKGAGTLSLVKTGGLDSWAGKGVWVGDLYVIAGEFDGNALKGDIPQYISGYSPQTATSQAPSTNEGSSHVIVHYQKSAQNSSSSSCRDNGDGTFTGTDGTVWQLCLYGQTYANGRCEGSPKNVSWYEAMNAAKDSTFAGKNDWIVPNTAFLKGSIHPEKCAHPNIPMSVRTSRYAPPALEVDKHFGLALYWVQVRSVATT